MTDFVRLFPAAYDLAEGARSGGGPSLTFAAPETSRLAPVIEMFVTPRRGKTWHGSFFGSAGWLTLFVATPDPGVLLVVAGGVGYVVPVDTPDEYRVLPVRPVREVHSALNAGLLLVVGFQDVLAIGNLGDVRWLAEDLISDSFDDVTVTSRTIVLRGYDPAEGGDTETEVDLARGTVIRRRKLD